MLKTGTVHDGRGRSPLVGLAGPIRRDDYDSISRSLVAYLRLRLPVPFLAMTPESWGIFRYGITP